MLIVCLLSPVILLNTHVFLPEIFCVCDVLISSISHYLFCSMMSKYFEWGQDTKLSCCKHQRETFFFFCCNVRKQTLLWQLEIFIKDESEKQWEKILWKMCSELMHAVADYKMCRNMAVSMVHDDDCLLLSVIFHLNTLVFVSGYLSW